MSVKDAIKKQSKQKTVQNRTNRVNTKAKKYNKEVSKSDKAYIQGDLRKSSSMKAYGVKKAMSDGQTVYGYGDDDIYTGGRKASNYKALQRGEKGVYETKYIKTRQTKDNPTVVKNADGSTSVYKSRYLTNKEKKNLDKYGDLKHRPSNIEKASKKIGSSVVKGLETLNKGQSAFLGGLKTIGDESQEMLFEPDKYKQTGGVKDTLSKLKTNIKDGWDKPTQSFGSIINEKMDKYESENDFKYSKAGRFNASASGLAMDVFNPYDLTPNVPVGTMLRGTGKSFTKVPTKVDADDVAKRLDKILDGKEISDIKKQHIIHKATQKANKMAGNINPNAMHGINIGNKELVSGQKVAEFADHLPMARTYNEIRHIIQKKKRGANLEDVIADVAKKKIGKDVDLVKPLTKTPLALQKEVYDTSTGFMPDFKIKQQIKELDNGFNNKTYEKPKSEYDELTEMLQGAIKESGRRANSGFKDITNHSDNLKPKMFDATDVQDIITSGDVRTDSLGRGLKPSKRRKGSSEYNAIFGSDNPITMTPRANLSDNASDLLDESILKERFVQEKQMKEYMNKLAKSNKTNKKIKVDNIKPRVKLNLDDRKSNFKSIYDNLDPKKITKEQQDVMSAVKALNNKSLKEEKQILIDKMNDVFFGGNSVIDDDVKPSKLKKIESFINELNTKKNVKFDDRYTQTLLRDLTDPIIDEKYSRLGKKYGYKKISEFTDRIKEIESILEANKQNKTLDNDTFKNLLWERSSLQKKVDSRNSELADDLKLNSVDFFERYPEMATGYRKNAYDGNGVLESFDDIQRNYINDNFTSSEAKFDDMVEEISNQIRPEIKLKAIMNKKNFKNKKEMDAWIQKQTMLEAEVIAKRNHSGLERVNKAESQHIAKGNRQEVDIDVKTKRIKEMNDAVRQHRKKLDLKYVDLKNKDKNKSIVEAKKNLMKIVESKWNDELDSDAVSELYRQQFQYLDKLGVDRGSYLEKFKTYEKKMEMINKMKRDYLNKDEIDFTDVPPIVKLDLQMLASRINKGEDVNKITKEVTDEFIGNFDKFKDVRSKKSDIINKNDGKEFDFNAIRNVLKINKDNTTTRIKSPFEKKYSVDMNDLPPTSGMYNGTQIINKKTGGVTDWIPNNATQEQVEQYRKNVNFANSDIKKAEIIGRFNSNPEQFFSDPYKMNSLLSNLNIKQIGDDITNEHLSKLDWYVKKYGTEAKPDPMSILRNPGTQTNHKPTDDTILDAIRENELRDRVKSNKGTGAYEDLFDKLDTEEDYARLFKSIDDKKLVEMRHMLDTGDKHIRRSNKEDMERAKLIEHLDKEATRRRTFQRDNDSKPRNATESEYLDAKIMNETYDRVQSYKDEGLAEDIADERERRSEYQNIIEQLFAPGATMDNVRRRSLENIIEDGNMHFDKLNRKLKEQKGYDNFVETQKAMNKRMKEAEFKANIRGSKFDNEQRALDAKNLKERIELGNDLDSRYKQHDLEKEQINQQRISEGKEAIPHSADEPNVVKNYYEFNESDKADEIYDALDKVLKVPDGLLKDFKSLVTVSKPGWHGANYIQNKVLNAQDIGIDAMKNRKRAKEIMDGVNDYHIDSKTGKVTDAKYIREALEEADILNNGIMGDLKNTSGSNPLSKFFHDVIRPSGKNSISTFGGILQKNRDEQISKVQNVLSHMDKGVNVFDAIDKSNKTLFDYDDLSKFEKNVMKRLVPFYAYGKKNTLNQAEYLMNDQRSFVKAMRGVKGFESAIPSEDKREIRDDESYLDDRVQLPFSKEQDGKKYDYMLNPKLPLQLKGSMDLGANPLIEPLLDIAKNEDFFGDEIEDKGKYYKDKVSGSFTPPLVKLMKKVEKSKKDDKEFKITPDILNYLLGISGNYY